jgi:hypothetical protein
MKLKTTLLAATLATFAASAPIAYADQHIDAKAETVKEQKTKAKKPVKKHSHMEEKTGMPMPEPATGVEKQESMKKMDMHDHTQDRH